MAPKAKNKHPDSYKGTTYNRYIPLASGYMAFEFRDKWYTQKKKVKLLHPMKDSIADIKKCIIYIEDNHLQNGQPFKDKKRHDNKKKEVLITRLKELWTSIGTEEIHEVEDNNKSNSGLPINRVVYYPSHRYRVNFYQSQLIGGDEAVHTQQALTRLSYPNEKSENIILYCDAEGKVSDDFYKQQPIDFSTQPKDYPSHIDVPFPGKSTIVPFDPVEMLPNENHEDPLDIYTAEMKESHAKEVKPVLLVHQDASVCASHWGKNPVGHGSLYHGACCSQGYHDWHAIFVPPQPQAKCHQCGGVIHVECGLDAVIADVGTCTFCFGCCPDKQLKKKYWLEALLSNKLKLSPPPPVGNHLHFTRPHYQQYPKVAKNGVIRERYLPKGVVQMCCCLHDGDVFVGKCQEQGFIQKEDNHGQCLVCEKYLHTKCSVYDIINNYGSTDGKDPGTKHMCYNCLSHANSKKVDRYWDENKTLFPLQNEGHRFDGGIRWIPYPVVVGDGPPTAAAVVDGPPPAAAVDDGPPSASAGVDGPPTASAGGEFTTQQILENKGQEYSEHVLDVILNEDSKYTKEYQKECALELLETAGAPLPANDPRFDQKLLHTFEIIGVRQSPPAAVAAVAADLHTPSHGIVQPDLEEAVAAKQKEQQETVGPFRAQDLVCIQSPVNSDYPSIPSWEAFLATLDPHVPPVVKDGQVKLTPAEKEKNDAAHTEYHSVASYKYILLLYDKGVFQCPGSMQSLTERRLGLFQGRDKRRDGRFQDVTKRKDRKSTPLSFDYDDEAEAEAAAASASDAGGRELTVDTGTYDYPFKQEYPFQWHHNWVGVPPTMFRLDSAYLKGVITALKQLTANPESVQDKWLQMNKETQLVALMKHTAAIVYFAIATQTGPLFEDKSKDHWTIGLLKDSTPKGYKEHEREVANQLFQALGLKNLPIKIFLNEKSPGKTSTGRTTFNHDQKITLYKTYVLYYLGMSGKPSWDGRLQKNRRKGTPWVKQKRTQNPKKRASSEVSKQKAQKSGTTQQKKQKELKEETQHPMMEVQDGPNAMEEANEEAKKNGDGDGDGDGDGVSGPSAHV